MATAFIDGAQIVRTKFNFVAAQQLHMPDVDPALALRYGSQSLAGMLQYVGSMKATMSLEYEHFEEDRIMPKILATAPGGGAGAAVTFTLDSTALGSISQQTPYVGGVTAQTVPVRLNDLLLIKPGSGTVSSSTYIRAFVSAVNTSAGTFVAAPLDPADSIPSIASADEIVIYGNAFGEDSGQPKSRNSDTIRVLNNLQILKETHIVTGTEENIITWVQFKGQNGVTSPHWRVKGEADTWKRFENFKELSLLIGEKITNPVIIDAQATALTPILATEGLIPGILSGGITSNYTSLLGWTLADAQVLAKNLDKQKGSKYNMLYAGFDLSTQIDDELGDRLKNGGVTYGNFDLDEEKMIALEFGTFSIAGYKFMKKTYDVFNDLQTLGAAGYTYSFEGIVIPMDSRNMTDQYGEKLNVESLRIRYMQGRDLKVSYTDQFEIDGSDRIELRYLSHCGFELTAANRFAYIKRN